MIPRRALAVGAHPDDVEFQCGGTLAKWAGQGCEIHVLVLTDGSKGSWRAGDNVGALVETRKQEAQAAGGALGARQIHFLNLVDGELETTLPHRAALCRVIREVRPDTVLGHDPWKRYRLHPDHRHAGFLTVDAVVAARDPHFFPDPGVPHHRPAQLLLFEADEPDYWESLDDAHVAIKIAALLEHRSQWRSTMRIESPEDRAAFEQQIHDRAQEAGRPAGLPWAEAFRRLETE